MAEEVDPDMAAIEAARRSLAEAMDDLKRAREEVTEVTNEFTREGFEEVTDASKNLQMPSSTKWYNFFERANKIPKDGIFELWDGTKMNWEQIVQQQRDLVRELAAEEDEGAWSAPSARLGVTVQQCPARKRNGAPLYRAKTVVAVPPRVFLLTQIRSAPMGSADGTLIYMREHYCFRGGQTSLVHSVRKLFPVNMFSLRDFCNLVNFEEDEDGTIVVSAQSLKALPERKIPNTVRGSTMIWGFVLRPTRTKPYSMFRQTEEVDGTEVTFLTQMSANGYVPSFLTNNLVSPGVPQYLRNAEVTAQALMEDGSADRLIKKFITFEYDEDEAQAEQEEGATD